MDQDLIHIVQQLLQRSADTHHAEVEVRIGRFRQERFQPGIDFDDFRELLDAFHRSPSGTWKEQHDKRHVIDFFYPGGVRARHSVRSPPKIIKKTTRQYIDIACTNRQYDIRFSLSIEEPVPATSQSPEFLRLKENWQFIHAPSKEDLLIYDFAKTVQGKTKEQACKTKPIYEVELEVTPPTKTDRKTASDLLEKAKDLLGRYDQNGQKVPVQLKFKKQWTHPTGTPSSKP